MKLTNNTIAQQKATNGVKSTLESNFGEEFIKLQKLIKQGKLKLVLKKSICRNDIFGVWLYWHCKTKPSAINLFGTAFYVYFIIANDWLWLPLAIFVGYRFGWFYGALAWIFHYIIQKKILEPIGQGFMIYDAQNDEGLFDDLWVNQGVGIESIKKLKSQFGGEDIPELIIDPYSQDWRKEINRENLNKENLKLKRLFIDALQEVKEELESENNA